MHTIAIANQKGGSGKTTTSVNLAACLAEKGKQVLLIDLDPQAQATTCFGVAMPDIERSVFAPILYKEFLNVPLSHLAQPVADHLVLIPSCSLTLEREKELTLHPKAIWRLKECLETVEEKYEYVLIDTPPSLGVLTHAALLAAQTVLLTIETSFLSLHGVGQLLKLIEELETQRDKPLRILALATLFDRRTNIAKAVLNDMRHYFKEQLLDTVVRNSSVLREGSSFGMPITAYARRSRGYEDYLSLAEEVLEKTLLEGSRDALVMDEITLLAHLYGEGKKTAQILKALGFQGAKSLKTASAQQLHEQGRIPLKTAERLITKSVKWGSLPLVVTWENILLSSAQQREGGERREIPSEISPQEAVELAHDLEIPATHDASDV